MKTTPKQITKEELREIILDDRIWLLLGTLISSDTITDPESADTSKSILTELKDALDSMDDGYIDDDIKRKIKKYIEDGINICENDKCSFLKNIVG